MNINSIEFKHRIDSFQSGAPSMYIQIGGQNEYTVEQVINECITQLPNNEWNDVHLVIDGDGIDCLADQTEYKKLLTNPKMHCLSEITFMTDGEHLLTPTFYHALLDWALNPNYGRRGMHKISFIVTCKLDKMDFSALLNYQNVGMTNVYVVVETEKDIECTYNHYKNLKKKGFNGQFCITPSLPYGDHEKVAEMALKCGFRYDYFSTHGIKLCLEKFGTI